MEVGIEKGFSIEDWEDFGKDGMEENLKFCRKTLSDSPEL